MAKRNLMIQEQVLAMILASTGVLPESLTKGSSRTAAEVHKEKKKDAFPSVSAGSIAGDQQEEEVLRQDLEYVVWFGKNWI